MSARVLTFHVDRSARHEIARALDAAEERLALSPSFRGLLCLEEDGPRPRVTVISLWDTRALDETAAEHAEAKRHFADTTGLGVTSRVEGVVRAFSGLHSAVPHAAQEVRFLRDRLVQESQVF